MAILADAGLTLKIKTALLGDERIGATGINVDTVDRTVYLRGHVPSAVQRQLAADMALLHGAEAVVNELEVEEPESGPPARSAIIPESFPGVTTPPGGPPSERAAVERAVEHALAADDRVNEHLIRVHVENGVAYLTGRAGDVPSSEAATEVAAHVPGIDAVENELEIMPPV